MQNYADASFLVSLILDDINSIVAKRSMGTTLEPLPNSALPRLEVRNGIRLALYRKEIRTEK